MTTEAVETGTTNARTKKTAKGGSAKKVKPARKSARKGNTKTKASKEGRTDTKKAIVLDLMRRGQGVTIAEIAKATDWQNHSIRGFISGTVAKKMGLTVESSKNEGGERTYRIAK